MHISNFSKIIETGFVKLVSLGAIAAFSLIAAVSAASAASLGSEAFVIADSDVYAGPGVNYAVTGQVHDKQEVIVTRCSGIWCLIDDEGGWIAKQDLSFGQHPEGLIQGPRFADGRSVDGTICFHDGKHFSGKTFCLDSGAVSRDLATLGLDNMISSISVEPGTSVNVCRDRHFASYCQLIDGDAATLPRLLDNSISSIQLWSPIN